MSKDLKQPQKSEDVDLGQLFKLIGSAFDRLFRFVGSVFNKFFLVFVWIIFFIKKHFLKLTIAAITGIVFGFILEKTSDSVYKSYITVNQNYKTGKNLYNLIEYYNNLAKHRDTTTLGEAIGIPTNVASSILDFTINSVISENEKTKNYDEYLKTLDSALASTINYNTYSKNLKNYTNKLQQITIQSKERKAFKTVFKKIVGNINTNNYFKAEQEKDIAQLGSEKQAIKEALVRSDSLQSTYKRVLEKDLDKNNGSEVGITFEGSTDKEKTREFDLYKSDLELRRELVEIERKIADKEHIIEITSSGQGNGIADNKKEILGKSVSPKLYYAIILTMLTFLVLLGLNFVKFLERYKNKV